MKEQISNSLQHIDDSFLTKDHIYSENFKEALDQSLKNSDNLKQFFIDCCIGNENLDEIGSEQSNLITHMNPYHDEGMNLGCSWPLPTNIKLQTNYFGFIFENGQKIIVRYSEQIEKFNPKFEEIETESSFVKSLKNKRPIFLNFMKYKWFQKFYNRYYGMPKVGYPFFQGEKDFEKIKVSELKSIDPKIKNIYQVEFNLIKKSISKEEYNTLKLFYEEQNLRKEIELMNKNYSETKDLIQGN